MDASTCRGVSENNFLGTLKDSKGNAGFTLPNLSVESCLLKNKGEYTIQQKLGSGFSAIVYRAVEKKTKRNYAIKYTAKNRQRLVNNEEEFRKTFEAIKALDSPYIVKYYSLEEDDQAFLLVMECCFGGDLIKFVKDYRVDETTCKRIMFQLFQAVNLLHASGILHRDIKLDNIMFKSKQRREIALGDFDMCLLLDGSKPTPSQEVKVVGTRRYMAPESSHEGIYTTASDMWCCGVVMFILFERCFPFIFRSGQSGQKKQVRLRPETISKYPVAADLMNQLLSADPASRISCSKALSHGWFNSIPYTISSEFWNHPGRRKARGAGWKHLEIGSKVSSQQNSSALCRTPLRNNQCSTPQRNHLSQLENSILGKESTSRVAQIPSSQLSYTVHTPTRLLLSNATSFFGNSMATYNSQLQSMCKLRITSYTANNHCFEVGSPMSKLPMHNQPSAEPRADAQETAGKSRASVASETPVSTPIRFRTRGATLLYQQANAKFKKMDCVKLATILENSRCAATKTTQVGTPENKDCKEPTQGGCKADPHTTIGSSSKKAMRKSVKRVAEGQVYDMNENVLTYNTQLVKDKIEKARADSSENRSKARRRT